MKPTKVLERKSSPAKMDKDWFMFSSGLMMSLCSDYISMRLLYQLERFTTAPTILIKMIEVAEKSMKLFVTINSKTKTALSDSKSIYGHSIEKLRKESSQYSKVFEGADICEFTSDLNDKNGALYQYLRYGSQETTDGMNANLDHLLPIIDKIFFSSLLLLPEGDKRVLNFTSLIKNLLTSSQFDQTFNKELLKEAILRDNIHAQEYLAYCINLDIDHQKMIQSFQDESKSES